MLDFYETKYVLDVSLKKKKRETFKVIMSGVWAQFDQLWQSLGMILEISSCERFEGTANCCSILSK